MSIKVTDKTVTGSSPCFTCSYQRECPGSYHIACGRVFDDATPLARIMAIFASVGRTPAPPPAKPVDFDIELTQWQGCGSWPSNYDGNTILSCGGWTPVAEEGR